MFIYFRRILLYLGILSFRALLAAGPIDFRDIASTTQDSGFSEQDSLIVLHVKSDKWIAVDKGYHLVGSLICTTGISNSCLRFAKIKKERSIQIGAGFTITLGLGKEFWDGRHKNNIFSWKDLTADILGIIIGSALLQID